MKLRQEHKIDPGGSNLWAQGNSQHFSFWENAGTCSQPAHKARCMFLSPIPCSVTLWHLLIDSGEKIYTRGTKNQQMLQLRGAQSALKHLVSHPCLRESLIASTILSNPELCSTQIFQNFLMPLKRNRILSFFGNWSYCKGNKKSDKHMKKLQ